MLEAAESQAVDCIVLDSYPALIPDEEDEKSMSEDTMAKGARLFGRFNRKAGKATRRKFDGSERPVFGIIVNQWRDKIGGFSRFGIPQTSPGGNGKNYHFWARVDVARDEFITEKRPGVKDVVTVGQAVKFKMVKNKGAAPRQTAKVDFYFRGAPTLGFKRGDYDVAGEYFSVGKLFGVVKQRGGFYYFGDERWQGEAAAVRAIREDRELQHAVAAQVLELAANPKALDIIEGS
jgi:recombination protein RecA